jgi:hypothetical protein
MPNAGSAIPMQPELTPREYASILVDDKKQMKCLGLLWGKESAWNPNAFNSVKVMGKHAGGIPQLLGLDPDTPAPRQIERGLDYIYYRYGTPCDAWSHWKRNGNY